MTDTPSAASTIIQRRVTRVMAGFSERTAKPLRDNPCMPSHTGPQILGVDFTSAPRPRKPITVAHGRLQGTRLALQRVDALFDFAAFEALLREPGPWVGAFDFPFGLPRELVDSLGWPSQWQPLMRYYAAQERQQLSRLFATFRSGRPVGGKWAHRATDLPAGASPSMRDVNPPVAFMMHAGVPRLIDAGVHLPRLHDGDRQRVALEGYPGLLARELVQRRSYKSDERSRQTPERLIARKDIVDALEQGRPARLGLRLALSHAQRDALVDDASGDLLDAVLCLMQAAWASRQPGWGLPKHVDPIEGWIVGA
jgi:hypothetical protein